MIINYKVRQSCLALFALLLGVLLVSGCAVNLPQSPQPNPADAHAPEAATAPLRPTLLATSRTFLSPAADDREQAAKQMDMSKMKHRAFEMGAMHDMTGATGTPKATPSPGESYYTCVMHPQIREAKPGNCPICGMTLIKKSAATEEAKP